MPYSRLCTLCGCIVGSISKIVAVKRQFEGDSKDSMKHQDSNQQESASFSVSASDDGIEIFDEEDG
jgi:hypothetical protein